MPNCRGPNERKRKLYLNVVLSMMLYGAPVWATSFRENGRAKALMRRLMRRITQRVCCAYRTVSFVAASMISGTPPLEYQAQRMAMVYSRMKVVIGEGKEVSPDTRVRWQLEARDQTLLD
ncbi:uncharacterized protein [Linepithema humile]|uniref:uncharacterized protein n=1 Tax=Linepithema humile TaxID=83485 RepID=UPI00351EC006